MRCCSSRLRALLGALLGAALTVVLVAPPAAAEPRTDGDAPGVPVARTIAQAIGAAAPVLDTDADDFDITAKLLKRVLDAKSGSALHELDDPATDLTCFLATDGAWLRLARRLNPGIHPRPTEAQLWTVVTQLRDFRTDGRLDPNKVELYLAHQCTRTSDTTDHTSTRNGRTTATIGLTPTVVPTLHQIITFGCTGSPTVCRHVLADKSPATPHAGYVRARLGLTPRHAVFRLDQVPAAPGVGLATATATCAQGGSCQLGDTGPGGGTVWYAAATVQPWGQYFEVAPNGWNGTLVDCINGCGGTPNKTSDWGQAGIGTGKGYQACVSPPPNVSPVTATSIGTGEANTTSTATVCRAGSAATQARGYTGGDLYDWSLPSLDELSALYQYPSRNAIGGFAAANYWSSSLNPLVAKQVWYVDFGTGHSQAIGWNGLTPHGYGVRAVRMF